MPAREGRLVWRGEDSYAVLEAIGGEMEGAGVYAAAAKGRTDWIVVKAISDWGYKKEVPGHQEARKTAARNAARFVMHVISTGGLSEPPPRRR